jgi:tricorn protease-like protein
MKTIDPAMSADGNYVYFSQRFGSWNYSALLPQYEIGVYDRKKGRLNTITSRYGSAFTPTLSPDGKWLVYGSRFEDKTGLIIREIKSGEEKWLAYPVQRDEQESIAPQGVLPGMSFTPDSKSLIASYGGKIWRLPVDGSSPVEIPFSVDVRLELGPRLYFNYEIKDTTHALAQQIRDAVPSPDGKKLAFTVLNRLYVMDYPNGTPKRVSTNNFTEAMPAWSPDGTQIVYVTWDEAEGGNLYKFNAAHGNVTKLTTEAAFYMQPAWSFNNRIAFFKAPKRLFRDAEDPFFSGAEAEIAWIHADGGQLHTIDMAGNRGNIHFTRDTTKIWLNTGGGSLVSMRWDATDEKTYVTVTGITTYGSVPEGDEVQQPGFQYVMGRYTMMKDPLNYCMLPESSSMKEPQNLPSQA